MSQLPEGRHLKVTSRNGVTEVALHSEGGPLVWNAAAERELIEFFGRLAFDSDTRVLILTGTGEEFCTKIDATEFRQMTWRQTWSGGQQLLGRLLDLNVIVIAAVNGPAYIHSEIAVIADIVLATPDTEFADLAHLPRDIAPADGVQLVWRNLLGATRTSYFFLTGEKIEAAEARRLGVVHEVLSRDQLLVRAREIANTLAARPAPVLAYTKAALRIRERRNFHGDLSHSLALEGLAIHAIGLRGGE